jgi:short subunit dehydrogenase-like uncharacterized protein
VCQPPRPLRVGGHGATTRSVAATPWVLCSALHAPVELVPGIALPNVDGRHGWQGLRRWVGVSGSTSCWHGESQRVASTTAGTGCHTRGCWACKTDACMRWRSREGDCSVGGVELCCFLPQPGSKQCAGHAGEDPLSPFAMPRAVFIAIVGATGFTGSRIVLELARLLSSSHPALPKRLTFALVGRCRARLELLLAQVAAEVPGFDASSVLVLVADAGDEQALRRVAASCHVVVSAAGPFARLGDLLLKACVAEGTHYTDVTGEPLFMERAELALHQQAQEAGVLLVPGCGFDSIPADLGCMLAVDTLRAAGAVATGVESYLSVHSSGAGFAGHYATLESAVAGIGSVAELKRVRSSYDAQHPGSRVQRFGPALKKRDGPHWASAVRAYALPFIGADASVVRRTQRSLVAAGVAGPGHEQLPVQFAAYVTFRTAFWLAAATVMGSLMSTLCRSKMGRQLVLALPRTFSLNTFSHEGPSSEQMATTAFSMTFFAQGRTGTTAEVAAGGKLPTNTRAVVRMSGPEPGYVATPRIVLAAAFELLEAANRVPVQGGVLTPAAAFRGAQSTMRGRLESLGACKFEVLQPATTTHVK